MEASKLMIGCSVMLNNPSHGEKRPVVVTGISPRYEISFPDSKHVVNLYDPQAEFDFKKVINQFEQFIEPIDLTPEILLEMGFVTNDEGTRYRKNDVIVILRQSRIGKYQRELRFLLRAGLFSGARTIHYVHEVQIAYMFFEERNLPYPVNHEK
jgi:hypothetical protein